MSMLTPPSSISLSFQPVHHVISNINTLLFGETNITNSTLSMTSNTPGKAVSYSPSQCFANTLPSFRAAGVAFTGAYLAELTANIPENVARYIIGGANFLSILVKAYGIVHTWPKFIAASNADKAKMIFTEAVPIIVGMIATPVIGAPARMVGYIFIPAMLDWFLNHISPNATDTRELHITTSWQIVNKGIGYSFGFVILPVPTSLPSRMVTPFKKTASELIFRSFETLNQLRNKYSLDDHKKITVPGLSFTHGNFAYEIAGLFSFILAFINANNLIFACERWSKPAGDFAPVFNNISGAIANIFNGTIAPTVQGAMSDVFHLKPVSKTHTRQGTITFVYQDGNKRTTNFSYDVQSDEAETGLAATMSPEATTRPTFTKRDSESGPVDTLYFIKV